MRLDSGEVHQSTVQTYSTRMCVVGCDVVTLVPVDLSPSKNQSSADKVESDSKMQQRPGW